MLLLLPAAATHETDMMLWQEYKLGTLNLIYGGMAFDIIAIMPVWNGKVNGERLEGMSEYSAINMGE